MKKNKSRNKKNNAAKLKINSIPQQSRKYNIRTRQCNIMVFTFNVFINQGWHKIPQIPWKTIKC